MCDIVFVFSANFDKKWSRDWSRSQTQSESLMWRRVELILLRWFIVFNKIQELEVAT